MHKSARIWLIVMAAALALAPVQMAWAHAQLLSTNPADSAVLEQAPEALTLHFNEPVSPLAIKLIAPDSTATNLLDATTGGETVTIPLPVDTASGTHVLSWRVVSTDGHPIAGSLVFSIGEVTRSATAETSSDQATSTALWASKAALFIALFFGIGGAVFRVIAELPRPARRTALAFSAIGMLLAPITLGLQGLDALGPPITSFFDSGAWQAGLATSYGGTAIAATLAFALALAGLLSQWRVLGLIGGALAALSLALSGHASAAAPQFLTRPAVFLHIAAILFWVGALLPLWCLLASNRGDADRALARFSRVIPAAVAALLLSGLILGAIQMGPPGPQWQSQYAAILAAKLVLLALLFALALWNRLWLTTPVMAGNSVAIKRLRRSIALEMLIVVIILGLVAGWRFTPPPRALAAPITQSVAADPIFLHAMDDALMAIITLTPGQAGPASMDIQLADLDYAPVEAQSINVTLSSPSLGIEPLKRSAERTETGWQVDALTVPIAGDWLVDLDVRVSRFELKKLQTEVTIP